MIKKTIAIYCFAIFFFLHGSSAQADHFANCFTGNFIFGEGKHQGEVELLGCEEEFVKYDLEGKETTVKNSRGKSPSQLLTADANGHYNLVFPPHLADSFMYIYFEEGSEEPTVVAGTNGRIEIKKKMYPVLKASINFKLSPLMSLASPETLAPFAIEERKKGSLVGEGEYWTIFNFDEQVYARE